MIFLRRSYPIHWYQLLHPYNVGSTFWATLYKEWHSVVSNNSSAYQNSLLDSSMIKRRFQSSFDKVKLFCKYSVLSTCTCLTQRLHYPTLAKGSKWLEWHFLEKSKIYLSFPLTSMEYHGYWTSLLAGWVFMHKIWLGKSTLGKIWKHQYNSELGGMSLASFCQSRAVQFAAISLALARVYVLCRIHVIRRSNDMQCVKKQD